MEGAIETFLRIKISSICSSNDDKTSKMMAVNVSR
jgi:hypothetical protein